MDIREVGFKKDIDKIKDTPLWFKIIIAIITVLLTSCLVYLNYQNNQLQKNSLTDPWKDVLVKEDAISLKDIFSKVYKLSNDLEKKSF